MKKTRETYLKPKILVLETRLSADVLDDVYLTLSYGGDDNPYEAGSKGQFLDPDDSWDGDLWDE